MGLRYEIKFPNSGLRVPVYDSDIPTIKRVFPETDFTPVQGEFDARIAALHALVDETAGVGINGAIHRSELIVLAEKYGVDAVRSLINSGRFTGI